MDLQTSLRRWRIENLTISGGGLAGPGNVTVGNQMTWSGGRLTGIGTLDIAAGAVMDVMGTSQLDTLLGGKTINNRGTINSTGWGIGLGSNDAGTATINNLSGATFNAIGDGDFNGAGFSSIDGDFSFGGVFNNAGTFRRSGAGTTTFGSYSFDPVSFNNTGSVNVQTGMLTVNDGGTGLQFDGLKYLRTDTTTELRILGSLTGTTSNADLFAANGMLTMVGGVSDEPRLLEVMGRDRGASATGFVRNFAYGGIQLEAAIVRLVDTADNSAGASLEALYVDTLIVPAGSVLDLNGIPVYARVAQLDGSVLNGTVILLSESGVLSLNTATSGTIATPNEVDEWTFF